EERLDQAACRRLVHGASPFCSGASGPIRRDPRRPLRKIERKICEGQPVERRIGSDAMMSLRRASMLVTAVAVTTSVARIAWAGEQCRIETAPAGNQPAAADLPAIAWGAATAALELEMAARGAGECSEIRVQVSDSGAIVTFATRDGRA